MGTLECPLCCQQNFESVGTLREHLIYYIYRPVQCGVCCLHLPGIREFVHHLRCHLGDELSTATKLSCPKPSVPVGSETDCHDSSLLLTTANQDGAGGDSDAGIGTAHLSDDFSSYMTGSDTANQLLKLREWRLEKLGKNFSRHRASFGRSPGVLESSPVSGRLPRSSSPLSVKDLAHDRRPSSRNSSYTARSDVPLFNRDIDSVERCNSSTTPLSVYGNVGSVEISDHSVCPQSVEKEVIQDHDFFSPAQPLSASHGTYHPSISSIHTTSCSVKQMGMAVNLEDTSKVPSPSISGSEALPKNINSQGGNVPDAFVSYNKAMSDRPRSPVPPSPLVPSTQEIVACSSKSSKNEFETIHDYNVSVTNFSVMLNKGPVTDNNVLSSDRHESNNLPVLEELSGDSYPQYHELQPVCYSKELSETVPELSDMWESCPGNNSSAIYTPVEVLNKPQSKDAEENHPIINSHLKDIQDNLSSTMKTYPHCYSNNNENVDSEKDVRNVNLGETNLHQDALKRMKNLQSLSEVENCNAVFCSAYEGQTVIEAECEEPYSLVDSKPYFHKKFHHDQERKVLSSTGVDQVADVSQYINSFQSVLVRKLNGTLSTNIPITSNICTNPEEDIKNIDLEKSQAQEHGCDVCHMVSENLPALKLHCKEHEKEKNCSQDLFKKCAQDPCEAKQKKRNKYQCDQCPKNFFKSFSISRHMKEVHAVKKSYICVHCNKAFSSKRHLQEHSGIHKGRKIHKCLQCPHTCYTASGLRTHVQEVHSKSEQCVSCKICNEKFTKVYGLKRHVQRKHSELQLTCSICSKKFKCTEDLNRHSKSHVDVGILKCDSCDKKFTTPWALLRHSKVHQSSPQQFKCNICNHSFTRKDSLVAHSYAHSQKKLNVCHCGKRFVKKSQLKEHQDKHSNVPKYQCSICKRSFKFKVSLKNHSCKKKIY